ncbi:MAG TPA: hypothetical protein VK484_13835, partial [Ferruginibacter sp.]|nr:hypothetical protein [Ferruginibacter sp.]
WKSEEDLQELIPEKLVVQKGIEGEIVGFSTVDDYTCIVPSYSNPKHYMNGFKCLQDVKN